MSTKLFIGSSGRLAVRRYELPQDERQNSAAAVIFDFLRRVHAHLRVEGDFRSIGTHRADPDTAACLDGVGNSAEIEDFFAG